MATATIAGIPVYNAIISDSECGMYKISLVDYPAVMSDFLAFSDEKKRKMYFVSDEEKRLVYGVVMRADFPIYRNDPKFGEYYIMYRADMIRVMAEKYLVENRQNDVNLMHEAGSDVEGVQMVQYFIKDSNMGVNPSGFDDIADGSLFAEFHVVNDEVWDAVKNGTYKGFSLEGIFDLVPEKDQEEVTEIADSLEGRFSKIINKLKSNKMGRLKKILSEFVKALQEFGSVTTDKGILSWDGDDDLKAGDAVFIEDEEGNRTAPENGDYTTEDGKVIKVTDGEVTEIVDDSAEVATDNASVAARFIEKMSMSYNEKERKISDAVAKKVGWDKYGWIMDAGDEFAVVEMWDEETGDWHFERFSISWENDEPIIGDSTLVKPVFVPEDFDTETLFNAQTENAALRAELAKLRSMPMAKPAHVEMTTAGKFNKTGNKGLDRLAEIASA